MKNFRFLPGLLLLASLSTLTLFSCKKEAQQSTTTIGESQNEVPDVPVSQRSCTSTDYCQFAITTSANVTLTVCGALDGPTNPCSCGCAGSTDVGEPFSFTAQTPQSFCASKGRKFCICNTGSLVDITIAVDFGSGPTPVVVPGGGRVCFEVSSSCVFTVTTCWLKWVFFEQLQAKGLRSDPTN
jgi:hypothetical protein